MRVHFLWVTIVATAFASPCKHLAPKIFNETESCDGLSDGHYPINNGCSQTFKVCLTNVSYITDCPDNLVFNTMHMRCDKTSNVVACKGEPLADKPNNCSCRAPEEKASWERLSKVYCHNKNDGLYNLWGCSDSYVKCENGKTIREKCRWNSYNYNPIYNPETKQCDYERNVKECEKKHDTTSSDNSEEKQPFGKSAVLSCSALDDGEYPIEGCSQTFKMCISEKRYYQKCPDDLIYNPQNNFCDKRENVRWCNGTTKPEPLSCNAIEKPPVFEADSTKWHKIQETFCCRKKDGDYTLWGCSSYYISCANGHFIMPQCSGNLVFNPETSQCDDENNVLTCRIVPTTTTTTTTTTTKRSRPQLQVRYASSSSDRWWY